MSEDNLEEKLKKLERFYVKNFIMQVQKMQYGAEKKRDDYINESVEYLHDKLSSVELNDHYSRKEEFETVAKIKEIIENLYKDIKNTKIDRDDEYYNNIEKEIKKIDKLRREYSTDIDNIRKKLGKESKFEELKD